MLKPTSHPLLWFKWPPHVYTRIHISAVNVPYCVLLSGDITSLRVIGFESLKKKAAACNTHKNSLHNITTFIPYWVPMGTTCTSKQFFFPWMFIKYTKTWFSLSFFYYTRTFEESSGILLLPCFVRPSVRPSVRFTLFVSLSANSSYVSRRSKSIFWNMIGGIL